MEKIGFEGFVWTEINVDNNVKEKHGDFYLYLHGKMRQARILHSILEFAGIKEGDTLKIYSQGSAIFLLSKEKNAPIKVGKRNGSYNSIGNFDFVNKLKSKAGTTEFEVVEAVDEYVLFRPIRKENNGSDR